MTHLDILCIVKISSLAVVLLLSLTIRIENVRYKQLLCGLDSDIIETVMRESDTSNNSTGGQGAGLSRSSSSQAMSLSGSSSDLKSSEKSEKLQRSSSGTSVTSTGSGNGSGDSEWRRLMNLLLQLRKICNHTYLMPDAAPDPYEVGKGCCAR